MKVYKPLTVLPRQFQIQWMASLRVAAQPGVDGYYRLVDIQPTKPETSLQQRITTVVIDENNLPIFNVAVAFSYTTASQYYIDETYRWTPPAPQRAHIIYTNGGGTCDEVQGSPVKEGYPGGMTVYVLDPKWPSDVVSGLGMLHDHTGVLMVMQLRRTGVRSVFEMIQDHEKRLIELERSYR